MLTPDLHLLSYLLFFVVVVVVVVVVVYLIKCLYCLVCCLNHESQEIFLIECYCYFSKINTSVNLWQINCTSNLF